MFWFKLTTAISLKVAFLMRLPGALGLLVSCTLAFSCSHLLLYSHVTKTESSCEIIILLKPWCSEVCFSK